MFSFRFFSSPCFSLLAVLPWSVAYAIIPFAITSCFACTLIWDFLLPCIVPDRCYRLSTFKFFTTALHAPTLPGLGLSSLNTISLAWCVIPTSVVFIPLLGIRCIIDFIPLSSFASRAGNFYSFAFSTITTSELSPYAI